MASRRLFGAINGAKHRFASATAAAAVATSLSTFYACDANAQQEAEGPANFGLYANASKLPCIPAAKTQVPNVPPPTNAHVKAELEKLEGGKHWHLFGGGKPAPVKHVLDIKTTAKVINLSPSTKYMSWTFDDNVPGPVIRARVGDWVEVRYVNDDQSGNGHNIDFHAVMGPGGGAPATYAEAGDTKSALFKMTIPGVYVYHCAAAPLPAHVSNGMYGIIIVDPKDGPIQSPPSLLSAEDLYGPTGKPQPKAAPGTGPAALQQLPPATLFTPDGRPLREFVVIQSDFYASDEEDENGVSKFDYQACLNEQPSHVVLNGREGALTEKPLMVQQGDRVRIYFGNAGTNKISSFHVIGQIFDAVWREGDLVSPPARGVQTVTVPAGGSAVVEFDVTVPGSFTLVDHALVRVDKGCVGFIKVLPNGSGKREDLYASAAPPVNCEGCKLHN